MGTETVGAYLRVLREAQRLSRQALARKLKVDDSQIERIEKGQSDTRGSFLLLLVRILGGSPEQVADLMLREDASPEDGRHLAEKWLAGSQFKHLAFSEEVTKLALALAEDPARFQKWLGYGERLLEETHNP